MTDMTNLSRHALPRHITPRHRRAAPLALIAVLLGAAMTLGSLTANAQDNPAPVVVPATTPTAPRATTTQEPQPGTTLETPAARAPEAVGEPSAIAPPEAVGETEAGPIVAERSATLPHDLSPWGMFMAADWVVKGVMIGLAFASLLTWTVWVAKSLEIAGAKARLRGALRAIYGAGSLDEALRRLEQRGGPGVALVRAAAEEVKISTPALDHVSAAGLKERVASRLSRIQAQAGRRLMRGTGVLATIGSTSPFVGLFGTVWGIMNSFIGISEAQTTNLAVVAPGIAEALLATALGLVAAIPAVMIYNVFARSITGYKQALGDAVAGIERLVSRDLDFRKLRHPAHDRAHPARPQPAGRTLAEAAE